MRNMMRYGALILGVALVLSACATDSTGGETTTTTASDTSLPSQGEGLAAPDFTFALADGSSFTLSDEQKPVYLVFWAEW